MGDIFHGRVGEYKNRAITFFVSGNNTYGIIFTFTVLLLTS